jgi:2-hydroxychromene-2-carboxylate isomerase
MGSPSGSRPAAVDFHLDIRCPYAYQTSLWIREVRDRTGPDPGLVDAAIADPSTGDEVLAEHQKVTRAGGFGVSALFFPNGQCLFGPAPAAAEGSAS